MEAKLRDVSQIPTLGNSNDLLLMNKFKMLDPKATKLISIQEPSVAQKEQGADVVFVRQFIGSKDIVEITISKADKESFWQNTAKNTKRAELIKEENLEDATLWMQPYTAEGKTYKYSTGMDEEAIQKFLADLYEVALRASEKKELEIIERQMKNDRVQAHSMGMTIESYYERYHPDRVEWIEQEKDARAAVKKRRGK